MQIQMLFKLLRVKQWYKNLLIFLPMILAQQFTYQSISLTIVGFFALCFASSFVYMLNDTVDYKDDIKDPNRCDRARILEKVTTKNIILIEVILLILWIVLSSYISRSFHFFSWVLIMNTIFYTFIFKKIYGADIISIGINFILRIVCGLFVIMNGNSPYIVPSMWLILVPFFFAIYLAIIKRKANLSRYPEYTEKTTEQIMIISSCAFIISTAIYTLSKSHWMVLGIPFLTLIVLRMNYHAEAKDEIAYDFSKAYKDKVILVSVILTTIQFGSVLWII